MTAIGEKVLYKSLAIPVLVFTACVCLTLFPGFNKNPGRLGLPMLADLLLTAPLAYYLAIRKTTIAKISVLRVFVAGILLAGVLLPNQQMPLFVIIKTWVCPTVELLLVALLVRKFLQANQKAKASTATAPDFLSHCREVLALALGSRKAANVLASEIAVFYYLFYRQPEPVDHTTTFTCYKENGIRLVLKTILFLFLVEAAGMHFLFMLWSKTAAWILTGLSLYTCLQLLAHVRALATRRCIISNSVLLLRNGLMGGDASIPLTNILKASLSKKMPTGEGVIKLALLRSIENHNLVLCLSQPVTVLKAFGIKKTGKVVLVSIDNPAVFLQALREAKTAGPC